MVAEKIDGTAVAKKIRERINQEIKKKQETSSRFRPSLTIVQGESLEGNSFVSCFSSFLLTSIGIDIGIVDIFCRPY